jgi:exodeoxyribonuclease V beta subunit
MKRGVVFLRLQFLVKDRYQMKRLGIFLEQNGIICSSDCKWDPFQSAILDAMEHLFHVLYRPNNHFRLKALLGSPFFKQNLAALQCLSLHDLLPSFSALKIVLEEEGLSSFFRQFLELKLFSERSVLENLASYEDLFFYHETMMLIEAFLEMERGKGFQLSHFNRFFQTFRKRKSDESCSIALGTHQVRLQTIHKSKGLEFPIVFAPGLAMRTPEGDPDERSTADEEKMRHFYVALTRAKLKVYLFFAFDNCSKQIPRGAISSSELFLAQALSLEDLYEPIEKQNFCSFFEEFQENGILSFEWLKEVKQALKRKEQRKDLYPPEIFHHSFPVSIACSFTSLAKKSEGFLHEEKAKEGELPPGPGTGEILHKILQRALVSKRPFEDLVREEIELTALKEHYDAAASLVRYALDARLDGFTLSEVNKENIRTEMEFFAKAENSTDYLKGFIDLFFLHNGKYYIIDWKSNWLPRYERLFLEEEMHRRDYFLQGAIYANAARLYLNLFDSSPFEEVFGGIFYIFLRALPNQGVYFFQPDFSYLNKRGLSWDM